MPRRVSRAVKHVYLSALEPVPPAPTKKAWSPLRPGSLPPVSDRSLDRETLPRQAAAGILYGYHGRYCGVRNDDNDLGDSYSSEMEEFVVRGEGEKTPSKRQRKKEKIAREWELGSSQQWEEPHPRC